MSCPHQTQIIKFFITTLRKLTSKDGTSNIDEAQIRSAWGYGTASSLGLTLDQIDGASWYYLWGAGDSGTNISKQWYRARDICVNGDTCRVNLNLSEAQMTGSSWWVRAWSGSGGYGTWSDRKDASVY